MGEQAAGAMYAHRSKDHLTDTRYLTAPKPLLLFTLWTALEARLV